MYRSFQNSDKLKKACRDDKPLYDYNGGLVHDIRRKLIHHQVLTVLKFIVSKIERKLKLANFGL
ncbi:hypothetical protein DKG77_15740 [Flagellimonas aquimarina]|uniref:Uncharacterized protein n=1 Tax=Flagellimonas aquimarina TaxID=2201895 RepID=A0A316KV42_9FLAO|nr:hypothetical protein DKG77_15740 [Allomuricauda koreensis]